MSTDRLRLALEKLQPSDWQRFERLASAFLASEFDSLRTVAAQSGDKGRDSELFSPEGEPTVVLQYSVAADWTAKIEQTVKRLEKTNPRVTMLIYVTNQAVGAASDGLRLRLRRGRGLTLDVRDRSWFADRVHGSIASERAAEELAQAIVDPFLASFGIEPRAPSDLSSPEVVAAVTYLGLQWKDDARDKGLTKLTFGALVRAALLGTDSEHRISREEVRRRVRGLLPQHPANQVDAYVDSALKRLAKRVVRHWRKVDEFCLSYEETQRLAEYKVGAALAESALVKSIDDITSAVLDAQGAPLEYREQVARGVRSVVDTFLLTHSQAFAMAVQSGSLSSFATDGFREAVITEIARSSPPKVKDVDWLATLEAGVREVLLSEDPAVQVYLRMVADAYTLLAFLRQTPDVQGAIEKMFSHGRIWLDATVILPLIAETLNEDAPGRFTRMIRGAREAGLELRVTSGLLEEIERHMHLSATCAEMTQGRWVGRVPYLLERYVASGRSPRAFAKWLENFRGAQRPEQDIAEYLEEAFGIELRDLGTERDAASPELRHALQRLWYGAQERRRLPGIPIDELSITRLVEHDVECYCGVVQFRKAERASPFGYSAWWLTLDRKTFDLKGRLSQMMSEEPPDSPVLSADFLVNYLAFGPVRRRIGKITESHLPLIMSLGSVRFLTPDLLSEAEALREEIKDLPERVVRRRVRDHLDAARRRIGPIARAGIADLAEELEATESMQR